MPRHRSIVDRLRRQGLLHLEDSAASKMKAVDMLSDSTLSYLCGARRSGKNYRMYGGARWDLYAVVAEDPAANCLHGFLMYPGSTALSGNTPERLQAVWLHSSFTRECLRDRMPDIISRLSEHHRAATRDSMEQIARGWEAGALSSVSGDDTNAEGGE
ncbi:MAG: hypothetical protein EBT03_08085 [Betaproteobacteria bacterium]|nr:hypothetical protein [Betaproteobacteria bacterium]